MRPPLVAALVALSLGAGVAVALASGGGDGGPGGAASGGRTAAAPRVAGTATRRATPPAPDAPLPGGPRALAARLTAADAGARRAAAAWRDRDAPPPADLTAWALDLQRGLRFLALRPRLERATRRELRPALARLTRDVTAAQRDLRRLAAGWPAHEVRVGPAEPLAVLERHYATARARFGVGRHVLAAVNLVESDFGRLRNASVSGAQGPMQFMPATWEAYGLGGDVRDPRDAILGAANYLAQSGAPGSYRRALYAYNPSPLYVDAVLRYARLIARDPAALPLLYGFQVYAGGRRLTGPGVAAARHASG